MSHRGLSSVDSFLHSYCMTHSILSNTYSYLRNAAIWVAFQSLPSQRLMREAAYSNGFVIKLEDPQRFPIFGKRSFPMSGSALYTTVVVALLPLPLPLTLLHVMDTTLPAGPTSKPVTCEVPHARVIEHVCVRQSGGSARRAYGKALGPPKIIYKKNTHIFK